MVDIYGTLGPACASADTLEAMLRQGMHLVITGSNSRLLSSELATHLTGRFMSVELMPFTFAEYRRYLRRGEVELAEGRAEARRDFDVYFENGGFPETFTVSDRKTYFKLLYDSILFRDILRRHKVRNPKLLIYPESVYALMAITISLSFSLGEIAPADPILIMFLTS